jgi:hypothetical protein
MRLVLVGILLLAITMPCCSNRAADGGAGSRPWSLIAEVNALRLYGLAPYEVNNALMAAAQGTASIRPRSANGLTADRAGPAR